MNALRTTLLLAGLTVLLIMLGGAIGGQAGMMIALIMAGVMNFGSYWFSDKIVLKMHNAREVGEQDASELYSVVKELAANADLPMPRVYIMDTGTPNAFATGRNPQHAAVAATSGLLQILDRQELRGVLAHELAHVRHHDTLISAVAATIAGAITMLANMLQWAMIFGAGRGDDDEGGPGVLGSLAMMILAPLAASLIQMAISRSREFAADKGGADISGDPMGLANALRKLEQGNESQPMDTAEGHPNTAHMFIINPLAGVNLGKLFSTHPPTAERIERLERMAGQARM